MILLPRSHQWERVEGTEILVCKREKCEAVWYPWQTLREMNRIKCGKTSGKNKKRQN